MDAIRQKANDIAIMNSFMANADKALELLPASNISSIHLPLAKMDMEFLRQKTELLSAYNILNSLGNSDILSKAYDNTSILPTIQPMERNALIVDAFKDKVVSFVEESALCSTAEALHGYPKLQNTSLDVNTISNATALLDKVRQQVNDIALLQDLITNANKIDLLLPTSPISSIFLPPAKMDMEFIRNKAFAYTEQSIFIALGNAIKQRKTAQTSKPEPSWQQIKQYFNKLQREYKYGQISLEQFQEYCAKHPKLQKLFVDYKVKLERKQKLKEDFRTLQSLGPKTIEQTPPPPVEPQEHKGGVAKARPQDIVEQKAEGTNKNNNTVAPHLRM